MKQNDRKGFTLAELLIVVAIIAVLVAIAIPVFANQLEKSRDATTISNLRSAYAEAVDANLTENKSIVDEIQITAKGKSGELSGLETELPFTILPAAIKKLGAGSNKIFYISFDFTDESSIKVSAGNTPYEGKNMTRDEWENRKPFGYFSGNQIAIDDPDDSTKWKLIDPEINKVYRVKDAYHHSGTPLYYRYDGTNWYGSNGEGYPWRLLSEIPQ